MIQLYFLAIALNLFCGLALVIPDKPHPRQLMRHFSFIIGDPRIRVAAGIFSMVVGLLKIVFPMEGDLPFVGDLLPALSCLFAGGTLVLEAHREPETTFLESIEPGSDATEPPAGEVERRLRRHHLEEALLRAGRLIGFLALAVALGHFLFPLEMLL